MENEEKSLNSKKSCRRDSASDEPVILDSWEAVDGGENSGGDPVVAQLERSLEQRAQQVKAKMQKEQEAKIQQEKEAMVQLSSTEEGGSAEQNSDLAPPTFFKILRRPQSTGNLEKDEGAPKDEVISQLADDVQNKLGGVTASVSNGVSKKTTLKPLEEREKAYAEARQRIFGDKGSFEEVGSDTEVTSVEAVLPAPSKKESDTGNTPGILKIAKMDTVVGEKSENKQESPAGQTAKPNFSLGQTSSTGGKRSKKKKSGQKQLFLQQQQQQQQPQQNVRPPPPAKPPVSVVSMPDLSRPPPPMMAPQQLVRGHPTAAPPGGYRAQQGLPPGQFTRFPVSSTQRGTQWSTGSTDVPYGCPPPSFYPASQPPRPSTAVMTMPDQQMRFETQGAGPRMAQQQQFPIGQNHGLPNQHQAQMYRQQNPVRIIQSTNQQRDQVWAYRDGI